MWRTLSADNWAIISQLQTHPSHFIYGVGTEALKTTFLLCQLSPYNFCQYARGRRHGWRRETRHAYPVYLLSWKCPLSSCSFPSRDGWFSAIDWLLTFPGIPRSSCIMPPPGHHPQLGAAASLGIWVKPWGHPPQPILSVPTPLGLLAVIASSVTSQGCLCVF